MVILNNSSLIQKQIFEQLAKISHNKIASEAVQNNIEKELEKLKKEHIVYLEKYDKKEITQEEFVLHDKNFNFKLFGIMVKLSKAKERANSFVYLQKRLRTILQFFCDYNKKTNILDKELDEIMHKASNAIYSVISEEALECLQLELKSFEYERNQLQYLKNNQSSFGKIDEYRVIQRIDDLDQKIYFEQETIKETSHKIKNNCLDLKYLDDHDLTELLTSSGFNIINNQSQSKKQSKKN